ncbi:hypothetical protein NFI96_002088 [Prochilodus magdalenae]|nr:hypothetical protein NFI96_002088 [Prochilodus magdalenae]
MFLRRVFSVPAPGRGIKERICDIYRSPLPKHFVIMSLSAKDKDAVKGFWAKILSHNLLLVLAIQFSSEFTSKVHVAMDKFLSAVALALSEKYR